MTILQNIKNNAFFYGGLFVGSISLIESYTTIYNAVQPFMHSLTFMVPLSIDLLVILSAYGAILCTLKGKTSVAYICKFVSYIILLSSWYLNNADAFTDNSINTVRLVTHTAIVLAWIYCTEMLIYFKKLDYQEKQAIIAKEQFELAEQKRKKEELESIKRLREEEIQKMQHKIQIKKLSNQAEVLDNESKYELEKTDKLSQKLDDTAFLEKNLDIMNKIEKDNNVVIKKSSRKNKMIFDRANYL